jgi:hypothetical protein
MRSWTEISEKFKQRRNEVAENAQRRSRCWPVARPPSAGRTNEASGRNCKRPEITWRLYFRPLASFVPRAARRHRPSSARIPARRQPIGFAAPCVLRVFAPPLFELLRVLRHLLPSNSAAS